MSPEQFLAAFEGGAWLTSVEVIDRLDAMGYWTGFWTEVSDYDKALHVSRLSGELRDREGLPIVVETMREYEDEQWRVYKLHKDFTADDQREADRDEEAELIEYFWYLDMRHPLAEEPGLFDDLPF